MIVYDHSSLSGWGIIFHYAGSALFNIRSILPAVFSGIAAGIISNYEPVYSWVAPKITTGTVVFSGIQFLVSLLVVNRVQQALSRYHVSLANYSKFNLSLLRLAVFFTGAIDASENVCLRYNELRLFRIRFLRWIRAIHVLALQEYSGVETPKYRMGTLIFTEEIILFREPRRAARVIRWLTRGYIAHRPLIAPSSAMDSRLVTLIDEVYINYGATLSAANQMYPFPLAQGSLLAVIVFGFWSPFGFGVAMPYSTFIAPCICFTAVWLAFGFNLAAQLLEWPYDGKVNDMPLVYYSMRFIKEMGEIEFGIDAHLLSIPLDKLIPSQKEGEELPDYVIPHQRPTPGGRSTTKEWLERAEKDLKEGRTNRKQLRSGFKPHSAQPSRPVNSMAEMKAGGVFKILH